MDINQPAIHNRALEQVKLEEGVFIRVLDRLDGRQESVATPPPTRVNFNPKKLPKLVTL